jgi:predicted nucleic acid-binding protein
MPKTLFDTRFFIEHYYSSDEKVLQRTKEELRRRTKERYISALAIHEVFWLTLEHEKPEVAVLRTDLLEKDFKVVDVDTEIAKNSAELRHRYRISMADSIIAATALSLKATCLSDDPHFVTIKEIKTRWL